MEHTKNNAKHIEKENFSAIKWADGFVMRYKLDDERKVTCVYNRKISCFAVFYAGNEVVFTIGFEKESYKGLVKAYTICRKTPNGLISVVGKHSRLRANKKIDETREKTEWLKK